MTGSTNPNNAGSRETPNPNTNTVTATIAGKPFAKVTVELYTYPEEVESPQDAQEWEDELMEAVMLDLHENDRDREREILSSSEEEYPFVVYLSTYIYLSTSLHFLWFNSLCFP